MTEVKDLTNAVFGVLTVIGQDEPHIQPSGRKRIMWKCRCKCGKIKSYREDSLKKLTSCGCLRNKDNAIRMTRHSESKTRLYRIYYNMINRCNNPKCSEYNRYGGRGILVCDEWLKNNESFFDWAYKNGYNKENSELSLERIDVDGNYCPENCKWITIKEQYNNMRKTIRIGNLCLSEFCKRTGLNYQSVLRKYNETNDIVFALGYTKNERF